LRALELVPSMGPLVSMLWLMLRDLYRWFILMTVPLVATAVAASFTVRLPRQVRWAVDSTSGRNRSLLDDAFGEQRGEKMYDYYAECYYPLFDPFEDLGYGLLTFFELSIGLGEIGQYTDCASAMIRIWRDPGMVVLFLLYGVIVIVLLLNMLIAMMAKTFDQVYDDLNAEHRFIRALHAITLADVAPVPPIMSLVWLTSDLWRNNSTILRQLMHHVHAARGRQLPPEASLDMDDITERRRLGWHQSRDDQADGGSARWRGGHEMADGGQQPADGATDGADGNHLQGDQLKAFEHRRSGSIDWTGSGVDERVLRKLEMAVYAHLGGGDADLNNELEEVRSRIDGIAGSLEGVHTRVDGLETKLDKVIELLGQTARK